MYARVYVIAPLTRRSGHICQSSYCFNFIILQNNLDSGVVLVVNRMNRIGVSSDDKHVCRIIGDKYIVEIPITPL